MIALRDGDVAACVHAFADAFADAGAGVRMLQTAAHRTHGLVCNLAIDLGKGLACLLTHQITKLLNGRNQQPVVGRHHDDFAHQVGLARGTNHQLGVAATIGEGRSGQ